MLLRSAQEEARILYAARRDATSGGGDALADHVAEAAKILEFLQRTERTNWGRALPDRTRAVGLILLVVLGLAGEFEVDSLAALESEFLKESP